MALKKFGQYVLITILDEDNSPVLETDNLRIDFDVRNIPNWSRAKVTLFNLNQETISTLAGTNSYVTIKVGLHGSEPFTIMDSMFVSNTLTTVNVPDSMTYLYCYSKQRKHVLEKQVSLKIEQPSLKRIITDLLLAGEHKGDIEFVFFPDDVLNYIPPKPFTRQEGSVMSCLQKLGQQHRFSVYPEGDNIKIVYSPDIKNLEVSSLNDSKDVVQLSTTNMRSNPKIGPARIDVDSNIDPRLNPGAILDITKLLTAEASGLSDVALSVAQGLLRNVSGGNSRYQVLESQHIGSNWTKDWSSKVFAVTPTNGYNMPTVNWFR